MRTCASDLQRLAAFYQRPRCLPARESPEMIATGTARMSGQGVATTSTATARIGSPVDEPGDRRRWTTVKRQKGRCAIPVGEARHRRLRAPALPRPGERCPHRCFRQRGLARDQIESGADHASIRSSLRRRAAVLHGDRFAGQRRLIEHRNAVGRRAPSTGTTSPLPNQQAVALVRIASQTGTSSSVPVAIAHGGAWRRAPRSAVISRRARRFGEGLSSILAARIHQRHDRCRRGFSPKTRAADIDSAATTSSPTSPRRRRCDDLSEQSEQNGKRPERPGEIGWSGLASPPEPATSCEAEQRDADE